MASTAQASVPVPAGLDLDEWFVAPPLPRSPPATGAEGERKPRKGKKVKGKETAIKEKGKSKRKAFDESEYDESDGLRSPGEASTNQSPEEIAEQEKVCISLHSFLLLTNLFASAKGRAFRETER